MTEPEHIDRPHAAAAAAKRLAQQNDALERAGREVKRLEAQLASARHAQMQALVTCVHDEGWPVSLAASATSISRETAHKWLRR